MAGINNELPHDLLGIDIGNFYSIALIVNDWNETNKSGFYMANRGDNAPTTKDDWFIGYCIRHNDLWCVQRVCSFASVPQKWYERVQFGGVWNQWQEVVDKSYVDDAIRNSITNVLNKEV